MVVEITFDDYDYDDGREKIFRVDCWLWSCGYKLCQSKRVTSGNVGILGLTLTLTTKYRRQRQHTGINCA